MDMPSAMNAAGAGLSLLASELSRNECISLRPYECWLGFVRGDNNVGLDRKHLPWQTPSSPPAAEAGEVGLFGSILRACTIRIFAGGHGLGAERRQRFP